MGRLAHELAEQQDWDGLVQARSELIRRAEDDADPDREMCLFGSREFGEALVASAPASYAVQGLPARPTPRRLQLLAATRCWGELEPHLHDAALRGLIAQERVCRGEDLRNAGLACVNEQLPWALQPWEPQSYVDPRDDDRTRHLDLRPEPRFVDHDLLPAAGIARYPDTVCGALNALWADWDAGGSVGVCGGPLAAIAALDYRTAAVAEISLTEALTVITRTVAWGGLHREGGLLADGRRASWELLAALAGGRLSDRTPEQLRTAGERTRWFLYFAERAEYEWITHFQLALQQNENGWAMWAGDTD